MILAGFIELIAKIKQKNNGTFKLVDAQDVECDDGKGLDEVLNEKLDENQGVENVGKTMVVGADGNLVIGDSSPKNVYTQEEVDYLLNDKMDKPYYGIAITDNATIENTLAGNFKMDSIEGSIYQAEESGIVPTPERPIPIRSKKITVDGEIVELRSLKETGNLFDINFIKLWDNYSDSMTILDDGTVKVTNNDATLRPLKTKSITIPKSADYTIKYDFETISGGANSGWISLVNMSNDNPKIFSTSGKTLYLDAGDYYVRFYRGQGATDVENNIVQYSNIVLVKGTSAPSTYIPPTVRDYKIVDHTNKTSKIVRNVGLYVDDKTGKGWTVYQLDGIYKYGYMIEIKDMKVSDRIGAYVNTFRCENYANPRHENAVWIGVNGSHVFFTRTNFKTLDEWKTWLKNNDLCFLYPLATPIEEEIVYSADDVSEVGYSWQDTTSPSPDIPSEIYEVDEINIKLVNNNIFSGELEAGAYLTSDGTKTIIPNEKRYRCKDFVKLPSSKISYQMASTLFPSTSFWILYYDADKKYLGTYNHFDTIPNNAEYITFYCVDDDAVSYINTDKIMIVPYHSGLLNKITDYVEAKETSIQHTLSKPLRATKDGSIADTIDIVKSEATYKMVDLLKEYITIRGVYKKRTNTITFIIYNSNILHPTKTGITDTHINCNMFKVKAYNNDLDEEYICLYSEHPSYLFLSIDKKRLDVSGDEDTNVLKQKIQDYINTLDIKISYEASKPTTEPLEDELIQKLKTLKTFSPVTNVFVEGIAKPKLNAKYPKDIALAQQQLEQKILLMSETLTETQANLLLQGGQN